ncbi:MAG: hypothetical protein WCL51_03255 [Bacteroidota bacterium]
MEQYNYFFVDNLNKEVLNEENPNYSFLIEVESKYYPDGFYFYKEETLLIRTKDDYNTVQAKIEKALNEYSLQKNIPKNSYLLQDANEMSFDHPHLFGTISAEEYYIYTAGMYLSETGIDLLHRK